jgi:hypothetical protein
MKSPLFRLSGNAEYRYSLRLPSPLSRAEVQESLVQAEALIARIQSRMTPSAAKD